VEDLLAQVRLARTFQAHLVAENVFLRKPLALYQFAVNAWRAQHGLASAIVRINWRTSRGTPGRPAWHRLF